MTTVIMTEWLTWFDKRIYGRRVLLLLDNFSAHEAAVQTLTENNTLFLFLFLYPLYYTTSNTAHAASRLWRYSPIYMNPLGQLNIY